MKKLFYLLFILSEFSLIGQAPTFQWVKPNSSHSASKIVSDDSGNIYTAGTFTGTIDLDLGPGTFTVVSGDGIKSDIFISKFDGAGNFIWGKSFGSFSFEDNMYGMTIDTANNIYLTGSFTDIVDFDPGPSTYTLATTMGNTYILKLNPTGNFSWAKQLGGTGNSYGFDISVDNLCNVYTTGIFDGTIDLDPGPGTSTINTTKAIFMSKLNSSGNFVWGKTIPCSNLETVYSIEADRVGNVYLTGNFFNTLDFDPGAAVFNLTSLDQGDIFLLKLDPSGNFSWVKGFSGLGNDMGRALVTDSSGNIILGGRFKYIIDFDPGPSTYTLMSVASDDVFILKLDGGGNFLWAKSMGNSLPDYLIDLTLDSFQNVYSIGMFEQTVDFDPGSGTFNLTAVIFNPLGFFSKLDPNGNFLWAWTFSSSGPNGCNAFTIDKFNNVYSVGYFGSISDFDPGTSTYTLNPVSSGGAYIHKLSQPLVGIQEFETANYFGIYPNPNNGSVTIELNSNSLVIVKNVLGEEIMYQTLPSGKQKLNLEGLSAGIYFVSVKEKDKTPSTQRIIITK